MRKILVSISLTVAAGAAMAQAPANPLTSTSATEVQALMDKAKATIKPGQPLLSQPLLVLEPYHANLEYRVAPAPPTVHLKECEMVYVVEGAGTLNIGGKLVDQKQTNADNLAGTAIEGGTPKHLVKGDFVIVPENTPHWFQEIAPGGPLVLMTLHLPRTSAAK
jgi:mannose-6-phosphate isomerase-like protein (cupin superfamily)